PTGARYQNKLSWDPTTAKFFDGFNSDSSKSQRGWSYDFRLNTEERAAFKKNGFVVSERMSAASFAEQFYRVFSRDLPIFITSDALLHAWHRSYDAMLEDLEETYLATALDEILAGMTQHLLAAKKAYGDGVLADSLTD